MDLTFYEELKSICPNALKDEPMKLHTTFRIGGPADCFLTPESAGQLSEVISFCRKEKIPYFVMGNGSNLLVSDKGIEGVVIDIAGKLKNAETEGTNLTADAGILMSKLARTALEAGLSGLEKASGIPGTLGGAVYMNAGAYGFEMKDVIKSVTYMDEELNIKKAFLPELGFGYRKSMFTGRKCVILAAQMELVSEDKEQIRSEMAVYTEKRTTKQPLNMPSAGSVFKRPEGYFAGALIEQAGLKGYSVGGAEVSEKHAGFIVNRKNASADDVLKLIEHIKKTVFEKFSVMLEPEIRMIGRE